MGAQDRKDGSVRRELLLGWVHLAVLWSFAVAQPLFEILADSPEFFVARGNTDGDILLLGFGLVLIPPTLLSAVELLFIRVERLRRLVHLLFVGALAAAVALTVLTRVEDGSSIILLPAVAFGAGAAVAYMRKGAVRTALTFLAPAPAMFLGLFLVTSPVSELFRSDDDVEVRQGVQAGAPVVMVVFDEFSVEALMDSRGRLDATRFPNFAKLARSATWYRNATTVSDHTTDAVPAILSGRYPEKGTLPTAADFPRNLFTLLGGAYSLRNVDEPATDLCPERLCGERSRPATGARLEALGKDLTIVSLHRLLPRDIAKELPPVDRAFGDFADQGRDAPAADGEANIPRGAHDDRPGKFERFVGGLDGRGAAASLNFLHLLLPHTPWQYLPDGRQYLVEGEEVPGRDAAGDWTGPPALARQAYQRNLLQVGYVDRLVGRLVNRLRAVGLWDRAFVVLVADHGISFRPGVSMRSAAGEGAADVLGVPLFIKTPDQRGGRVDDGRATTADILPTIADALGMTLDWPMDGTSLLARARPEAPVTASIFPSRELSSVPFAAYIRARDTEVARTWQWLGGERGWQSVYAPGSDSDLFGRAVTALRSSSAVGVEVQLDGTDPLSSVRPDASLVPAFVRGRLTGEVRPGMRLAVAVNGRVGAVTRSYQEEEQTRLGAIVPSAVFRTGRNEVEVYAVLGQGSSRRLALVRETDRPAAYRSVERDGETTIEGAGKRVRVEPGRVVGYLEQLERRDRELKIGGWAVDSESNRPADRLLVFEGSRLIAQGRPTLIRPDVVTNRNASTAARSGFRLSAIAAGVDLAGVRVFAVSGDAASRLPRYKG